MNDQQAVLPELEWDERDPERPDIILFSPKVKAVRNESEFLIVTPFEKSVIEMIRVTRARYVPGLRAWSVPASRINDVLQIMQKAHELLVEAGLDNPESRCIELISDWSRRPCEFFLESDAPSVGENLPGRYLNRIAERVGEPFEPDEKHARFNPHHRGHRIVKVWHRAMTIEDIRTRENAPSPT